MIPLLSPILASLAASAASSFGRHVFGSPYAKGGQQGGQSDFLSQFLTGLFQQRKPGLPEIPTPQMRPIDAQDPEEEFRRRNAQFFQDLMTRQTSPILTSLRPR